MAANRRTVLTVGAAAFAMLPVASFAQSTMAKGVPLPDLSGVKTAKQFSMGVIGPAELSLETSKIAVSKATNPMAKEFANFELTEAMAVIAVLTDLGTPVPNPDANSKMILDKVRSTAAGIAFDRYYIEAQYDNHVFLRELAAAYLRQSTPSNAMEKEGRHLATLALSTFTEHAMITQRISTQLMA